MDSNRTAQTDALDSNSDDELLDTTDDDDLDDDVDVLEVDEVDVYDGAGGTDGTDAGDTRHGGIKPEPEAPDIPQAEAGVQPSPEIHYNEDGNGGGGFDSSDRG